MNDLEKSAEFWIGALKADAGMQQEHISRHEKNNWGRACVQVALGVEVDYLQTAFEVYENVVKCSGVGTAQHKEASRIFNGMINRVKTLRVKYESV